MMYVDKKEVEDKPIDKIVGQTMQVITGRITKKYEFKYLTGHYVPENIGYHIHITKTRATIYMTNSGCLSSIGYSEHDKASIKLTFINIYFI